MWLRGEKKKESSFFFLIFSLIPKRLSSCFSSFFFLFFQKRKPNQPKKTTAEGTIGLQTAQTPLAKQGKKRHSCWCCWCWCEKKKKKKKNRINKRAIFGNMCGTPLNRNGFIVCLCLHTQNLHFVGRNLFCFFIFCFVKLFARPDGRSAVLG